MSDLIADNLVTITCADCHREFQEKMGRLKDDPEITCPHCETTIHIKADGLRASLDAIDKKLDNLRRKFSKRLERIDQSA